MTIRFIIKIRSLRFIMAKIQNDTQISVIMYFGMLFAFTQNSDLFRQGNSGFLTSSDLGTNFSEQLTSKVSFRYNLPTFQEIRNLNFLMVSDL